MKVICLTRVRQDGKLYMPGETISDVTTDRAGQLVRAGAATVIPEPEVVQNGHDGGEPILSEPDSLGGVGIGDGGTKTKVARNSGNRSRTAQGKSK